MKPCYLMTGLGVTSFSFPREKRAGAYSVVQQILLVIAKFYSLFQYTNETHMPIK